jgi:hypothetical protein
MQMDLEATKYKKNSVNSAQMILGICDILYSQ